MMREVLAGDGLDLYPGLFGSDGAVCNEGHKALCRIECPEETCHRNDQQHNKEDEHIPSNDLFPRSAEKKFTDMGKIGRPVDGLLATGDGQLLQFLKLPRLPVLPDIIPGEITAVHGYIYPRR